MLGNRGRTRSKPRDEGEKPFWISFADLMSALMVLFLVVMSVAISNIITDVNAGELAQKQHTARIDSLLKELDSAASQYPGITIDSSRRTIDYHDRARFGLNRWELTGPQQRLLREFIPTILRVADSELGQRVLKRIVVEGFTDNTGSYLWNLNLSLQRSQSVLCAMFAPPLPGEAGLDSAQRQQIRKLFLVGGYSSNNAMPTAEASRRVEMRLEFLVLDEVRAQGDSGAAGNVGTCALIGL